MAGGRPVGSGLRVGLPDCPRHPGSRVVRCGHYGTGLARRQLYRCYVSGASHTFAGVLPLRMLVAAQECDTCEVHLEPHQGPQAPRRYTFSVREVAAALMSVANGETYTRAAVTARLQAGREELSVSYGAQLVGNWVETLSPIVTAPWAETAWPETIVCDSTDFWSTDPKTKRQRMMFNVLVVYGYEAGAKRGRLWALHATHRANAQGWLEVFDRLPGTPTLVVSDKDPAITSAVKLKWPQVTPMRNWSTVEPEPFWLRCEYHLRENALAQLRPYGLDQEGGTVVEHLRSAFHSPQGWAAFRRQIDPDGYITLNAWCDQVDAQVRAQTSWRSRLPAHHSNAAAENLLDDVKAIIEGREFSFRNKVRTNRMLELVRLRLNHRADELVFARTLRAALETGQLPGHQLQCRDKGTRVTKAQRKAGQRPLKASLHQ